MQSLLLAVFVGVASAFVPPASMQQLTRATVTPAANVEMFTGGGKASPKKAAAAPAAKKAGIFGRGPASPTKPVVTNKARPLSPVNISTLAALYLILFTLLL